MTKDQTTRAKESLSSAIENLRRCVNILTEEPNKTLLYRAGMTIRKMQQNLDPDLK